VFWDLKVLILLMKSGGFEESTDGFNSTLLKRLSGGKTQILVT